MKNFQLQYKNSTINYYRFGSGPRVAICFHGYGEDATTFGFLEKFAGNYYSFISIDLPFHGKTKWNEGLNFTHKDLVEILKEISEFKNNGPKTINHKLTLLGFSLGGRIALSIYQAMPEQIEKIILLAPDGLKVNFWYWLATQTWLGNRLFYFTMKHPGWFFSFLKILNKLNLVNTSIFKFVNFYIGDKDVRQLLYQRWMVLRKLKPGIKKIKSFIQKNDTKTRLIYGIHDRIILPARGEKFRKEIEKQCTLAVIHSGHQILYENHAEEILPALLH
ncbi:MAG TPA: alpha/beta hydrolase [Chitinophagaceae bacterium]|nr:alpha/beta hydrolase [Chitinophagaceae bacterium]